MHHHSFLSDVRRQFIHNLSMVLITLVSEHLADINEVGFTISLEDSEVFD